VGDLVIIENGQAVTDSLTVAQVFGKEHARVMRDIRELGCSEEFRVGNFAESSYVNQQRREMPLYYMNQKAFTLLVMGYTGPKAMGFKERYINEFERMENELRKPKVLSEREQLMATMKLTLEASEEIAVMKEDVTHIKYQLNSQMTIDYGQQSAILNAKNQRVEKLWAEDQVNKNIFDTKRKLHAQAWRDLKLAFAVASYRDIRRKDFDEALQYVKAWRPRMV